MRLRTVRAQADIGLDIIKDGEFGKTISWSRQMLSVAPRNHHCLRNTDAFGRHLQCRGQYATREDAE